jgi:hypothetical protein
LLASSKIEKRITLSSAGRIGANSASNQGNRKVNSASEEPLKEVILSLASLLSLARARARLAKGEALIIIRDKSAEFGCAAESKQVSAREPAEIQLLVSF